LELQATLLQRLSQYPDLLVREQAREEAPMQGKTDFLLDGSLRQRHPGWELAVRLRDLDEDRVLWSDAFPVARQDLEAAGDRVVRGLARTLKVHPR
jgi:TolB-like protein